MEKTSANHHSPLPVDLSKRIEMVVAVCISMGYVNRNMLAQYFGLSQLQASMLLREFLQHRVQDIRRAPHNDGYTLVGYPKKVDDAKH